MNHGVPKPALAKASEVGAQTDVWAVGATLFTLLSGMMVHLGENAPQLLVQAATRPARSLAEVAPEMPEAIVHLVDRALAFAKRDRWSSAVAMQQALRMAWRTLSGGSPSRESLESFFMSAGGITLEAPPTCVAPPSATGENVALGTTARPVSNRAHDDEDVPGLPRRRGATFVAMGLMLALAVIGAAWGIRDASSVEGDGTIGNSLGSGITRTVTTPSARTNGYGRGVSRVVHVEPRPGALPEWLRTSPECPTLRAPGSAEQAPRSAWNTQLPFHLGLRAERLRERAFGVRNATPRTETLVLQRERHLLSCRA